MGLRQWYFDTDHIKSSFLFGKKLNRNYGENHIRFFMSNNYFFRLNTIKYSNFKFASLESFARNLCEYNGLNCFRTALISIFTLSWSKHHVYSVHHGFSKAILNLPSDLQMKFHLSFYSMNHLFEIIWNLKRCITQLISLLMSRLVKRTNYLRFHCRASCNLQGKIGIRKKFCSSVRGPYWIVIEN